MPERELARITARALVERRGDALELELDPGPPVGGQLDGADAADGAAAHLHLVADDQLPGVLEDGGDGVAAATAEHERGDERPSGDDTADRGRTHRARVRGHGCRVRVGWELR